MGAHRPQSLCSPHTPTVRFFLPLSSSYIPFQVQLLLFSATFNDVVKRFAVNIAPSANQVGVVTHILVCRQAACDTCPMHSPGGCCTRWGMHK